LPHIQSSPVFVTFFSLSAILLLYRLTGESMDLAEKVIKGDVRAAARLITLIEEENPEALEEMSSLFPHTGQAYIIGVTGAPGVGKSTLLDSLIGQYRKQALRVGVIAIDPTSALTGGALLGDRIRMQRHAADEQVFIRSLATRGWTGGLAKAALGAAHVMDAMGKDIILIETVGSGQVEIDIVKAADTTLLVMAPGSGDEIQMMKAGILESADVIAINKADTEGATRLKADLEMMREMSSWKRGDWSPPIVMTEAVNDKGTAVLAEALTAHRAYLKAGGGLIERRQERYQLELMEIISADIKDMIFSLDGGRMVKRLVDGMQKGKLSPRDAAREIMNRMINREG
jgi:LAO/AO transport system kinase